MGIPSVFPYKLTALYISVLGIQLYMIFSKYFVANRARDHLGIHGEPRWLFEKEAPSTPLCESKYLAPSPAGMEL